MQIPEKEFFFLNTYHAINGTFLIKHLTYTFKSKVDMICSSFNKPKLYSCFYILVSVIIVHVLFWTMIVYLVTGHLRWTFHGAEHWNVRIKQDCQDDPVGLLLTTFTRFKNSIASNATCVSLQINKDEQLLKAFLYAKVFFANQREVSMGWCFSISIGEGIPPCLKYLKHVCFCGYISRITSRIFSRNYNNWGIYVQADSESSGTRGCYEN